MIATYPNRRFKLWEYKVSHGSLLIRSPKSLTEPVNIDVLFVGVAYLGLPAELSGISVARGGADDLAAIGDLVDIVDPRHIFVVESNTHRFPIVAVDCRVEENANDIFDSPFH